MRDQDPSFVYSHLEWKLSKRLYAALSYINTLASEDVLRCDNGCLTEIVRQFAVVPPIPRSDLMVADKRVAEMIDLTSDRKTGQTGHCFFIPIEREPEWLEEVDSQRAPADGLPLAFLDEGHARITLKIMISPEGVEGELKHRLDYRVGLVEQYARFVADKIAEFNKQLTETMVAEFNQRKRAIERARRELEETGVPLAHNPEGSITGPVVAGLLGGLRAPSPGTPYGRASTTQGVRSFIVHGHDDQTLFELKDYLQNNLRLGEPVILRQMPGLGKTIIEKFEDEADGVQLVFVLLTPDDRVLDGANLEAQERRARQNVILELGFFLGKLGRRSGRVLLLHKGPVEIPSDIAGIEYIDVTAGIEIAGERIRRALRPLGI